jgi:hypothetical protein
MQRIAFVVFKKLIMENVLKCLSLSMIIAICMVVICGAENKPNGIGSEAGHGSSSAQEMPLIDATSDTLN